MDPCSGANIQEVKISHVDLHITCNMTGSSVYGRAFYQYQPKTATRILLDTNHLNIIKSSHPFKFNQPHPVFGQVLEIDLSENLNTENSSFSVDYQTTEFATAIQYLGASQTSSKTHSFLYTQCQAIHCRTLFPCQDTPQVKFTINYHLSVPINYSAAAAGIFKSLDDSIPGYKTYNFVQSIPVSSYLVAFAVGNLSSFTFPDPKFTIYAEPEVLKLAVFEFSDLPVLLSAAEEIMTPYFWGNLDLIILPGSFPFGGMENPNLIFVTPSLLAGDKSLVSTVTHEIAHSWTGNTVTNSTWEHFWLNEGFTVYLERKITSKVFGKDLANLEQIHGLVSLEKTVNLFGSDHNFTRLNLEIDSVDPDDAFSLIPYEKGCCFLLYLESLVGESNFLEFLREYVNTFRGRTIDSQGFKQFFLEKFTVDIDWELWLKGTGMPPWVPSLENPLINEVKEFLKRGETVSVIPSWTAEQFVALLVELLKNPSEESVKLCEFFEIPGKKNAEIRLLWLTLVIKTKSEQYYKDIAEFLSSIGRMKFVRPLFRALWEEGLNNLAREIFEKNKTFYHSTLIGLLQKEFNLA